MQAIPALPAQLERSQLAEIFQTELRTVGKRIAFTRKRLGWTHEQLAVKANLHHMRVRRMEWGYHLNPFTIKKLANALGVTTNDLFPGRNRAQFIWQFHRKWDPLHWGESDWDRPLKPEINRVNQHSHS